MSLLFTVQQQNAWLVFDGGHVTRSDTRPRRSTRMTRAP